MASNTSNYLTELPFYSCSSFAISHLFQTPKNNLLEMLKNNSFSDNMIKLVNGFSKDNYTCNYYNEGNINDLAKNIQPTVSKFSIIILTVLVKIALNWYLT